MKKIVSIVVLLSVMGCTSLQIPVYIPEEKPFTQRFYAGYPRVVSAVRQALTDQGWSIDRELEPRVFELAVPGAQEGDSVLLVSGIRESRMFFATRYARLNVYIFSKEDVSDVELRYLGVNSVVFFKSKNFGDKDFAKRLFKRMEELLG